MAGDKKLSVGVGSEGVLDALPGMVWTTEADGRGDFVNRRWREYTGLSPKEARGHGWQRTIHPEDIDSFLESWTEIKRSGVTREIEGRLRRFDGEYRWFACHASPLSKVGGGEPHWCWLAVCVDEGPTLDGRLRRFIDMLPWQAGFLDRAGVLEFTNLQSMKDFGMTKKQLEEWLTSGIIHADDHDKNQNASAALLATGELYDEQLRMRYPGGIYRWTRARCVPVRDGQGNVIRYVTFQVDVDDLKRAEDLLAAEVNLLEMVTRGEPLRQILDALSRHVEALCNGCSCSVLVADVNEETGGRGSEWRLLPKTNGHTPSASLPIMAGSGDSSGVITVDRPGTVGLRPEEQALVDRFSKIAGIAIDRARADAALQRREGELRDALSQLAEGQRLSKTGSFTWDVRADEHSWSDEVRRIFGFGPDSTVNISMVQAAVHPEDIEQFDRMISAAAQGSQDFELVFRVLTTRGELRHAHVVGHRVDVIPDRPIFIGAIQDVTDREVAEEGLNRARAELAHVSRAATLSTMTASIAHEVSQPIAGILTNASTLVRMLAAEPPNLAGASETARRTIRDANRASEVIKRLRAMFSKKAPTMEVVDLNETAREVVALSTGELQRARATLQVHFTEGLPGVLGDRIQLQQVILNLLLNAADAMSSIEGRPRALLIQTERYGPDLVRLFVRDSGVGIDMATVEKLFDAFYTTKAHGMGVGLAISRSIIESHKGQLWALANEGPGATFGFNIPCAPGL